MIPEVEGDPDHHTARVHIPAQYFNPPARAITPVLLRTTPDEEPALPIYEGVAFASKSPVAETYSVEGNSTIPSDGRPHKVSVAQLPFEAAIKHVTVPRQQALVYIQVITVRI